MELSNLYVLGNKNLLQSKHMYSVAGSRKITVQSANWLKETLGKLAPECVIVSGLALGTDTIAHKTALENGNPTIAVLPCGFSEITPKSNTNLAKAIVKNGGLLVSEYPFDFKAKPATYVARNKIIAELGKALIVPQCEIKSGTMHTVRFAQKLGKPIFVQKGTNFSGNNYILTKSPSSKKKYVRRTPAYIKCVIAHDYLSKGECNLKCRKCDFYKKINKMEE